MLAFVAALVFAAAATAADTPANSLADAAWEHAASVCLAVKSGSQEEIEGVARKAGLVRSSNHPRLIVHWPMDDIHVFKPRGSSNVVVWASEMEGYYDCTVAVFGSSREVNKARLMSFLDSKKLGYVAQEQRDIKGDVSHTSFVPKEVFGEVLSDSDNGRVFWTDDDERAMRMIFSERRR